LHFLKKKNICFVKLIYLNSVLDEDRSDSQTTAEEGIKMESTKFQWNSIRMDEA
jgi:hypothetical protein